MSPLVLVAGVGAAALLARPARAPTDLIGQSLAQCTLESYRVVAPAGPGSSKPLAIPAGARAVTIYDSTTAGASVYAKSTDIRVHTLAGTPTLHVYGPTLLELRGTLFLPADGRRLTIINGASPVGIPSLMAVVIFHVQKT